MSTKADQKSLQTLRTLEEISGESLSLGGLLCVIREGDEITQVEAEGNESRIRHGVNSACSPSVDFVVTTAI